ncbi:MAG: hypothetical protein QM778_15825 [Myxococcales bacterium]
MDDAERMSGGHALHGRDEPVEGLTQGNLAALVEHLLQAVASQILHHQERTPRVFGHVVDVDHVGMVDLTDCTRLALKAGTSHLVVATGVEPLDGHELAGPLILREENRPHTATPKHPLDAVLAAEQFALPREELPGIGSQLHGHHPNRKEGSEHSPNQPKSWGSSSQNADPSTQMR